MYPWLRNYFLLPPLPPTFNNYHVASHHADLIKPLSLIDTGGIYVYFEANNNKRSRNYILPILINDFGCGNGNGGFSVSGRNEKNYKFHANDKFLNSNSNRAIRFSSMKRRISKDKDPDTDTSNSSNTEGYQPPMKRQQLGDPIHCAILTTYLDCKQTEEIYLKKMRLRDAISTALRGIYSDCHLFVVGSSENGFGSKTSDMDMCLLIRPNELWNEVDQRVEAPAHLRNVYRVLKKCEFIQKLELITAKVPILKFRDRISGVEVDLNVNNTVGIRNTHLLRCYSKVDPRVSPLVGIVKIWAHVQDINNAKLMTISSYSLTLMVIHYLQCGVSPAILPSLQKLHPYKFSSRVEIQNIDINDPVPVYLSKNEMSLGELMIGFLDYFTNRYDFRTDAMSIRTGSKVPKFVVQNQRSMKNNPGQWKCLCIEEPFELTNTARSVYDDGVFSRVKSVFQCSWRRLRETKKLGSIIHC
uniref:Uncharacterized protein n=1 Tax=Strigamia maritima TaxID=126957 RepID=T1JEY6_STRMM